ncbi:MAG: putative DNA modification/repair radical SAM protein [Nanoarchaeota archaeon]|nr:putative DNA modification/repair radical SAM protein [Nanoarchaeota archaeon]
MNTLEKVKILGAASKYDICASSASPRNHSSERIGNPCGPGICKSFTPDGRCVTLFKVLYSNSCTHDCKYCMNNNKCSKKVAMFEPQELAQTFMKLYLQNYVEGLFLSSGIVKDSDYTMGLMLDAVRLLREKYLFNGYVHLKVLPGSSLEMVKQAAELSDRLSLNLEVPSKTRMSEISEIKDYKVDIIRRHNYIKRQRLASGATTQFVVGSTDESDFEILEKTNWMYERMNLKRVYFNAFVPVPKTDLQNKQQVSLEREHRLYQVDFMLRKYNISFKTFKKHVLSDNGMLPRGDPKIFLAKELIKEPVSINSAGEDELLKVPGIGPLSAKRIISFRRQKSIKTYSTLQALGVVLKRAKSFINLNGIVQRSLGDYY